MEAVEVIKGIPAVEDRGPRHETPIQGIQKIQPMHQCRGGLRTLRIG